MSELRPERGEPGFVLVAVVMIVLALTTLGLSLFSLSSFESQFLRRSMESERAFYEAASAMERAKFNLNRTSRLEHAGFGLGGAVDTVRAWQWKSGVMVESGPMDPGIVHLRVHARAGDAGQTLSARYLINTTGTSAYRRLITTSGAVSVQTPNQYLNVGGVVYHRASGTSWTNGVTWVESYWRDSVRAGVTWIPEPDVNAVFAAHPNPPSPVFSREATVPVWSFDAQGQEPGYFGAPDSIAGGHPAFSFAYLGAPGLTTSFKVRVRGPVVWLLPRGFYGFGEVTIERHGLGSNTSLTIIAGPNSIPADYPFNIRFEDGIHNPDDIPIVLVSSGRLELLGNRDQERSLDYVSIYAGDVRVDAKENRKFFLLHPRNSSFDQPGGLIDRLISWGALPNGGTTVSSQLQLIAGSWQEVRN